MQQGMFLVARSRSRGSGLWESACLSRVCTLQGWLECTRASYTLSTSYSFLSVRSSAIWFGHLTQFKRSRMKFSRLGILLTTLAVTFGPIEHATLFQEDFAGKHNLSTAMFTQGVPLIARDLKMSRNLDILSGIGFLSILQGLRSLCVSGLAWLGVPCSSWIFLSRGSTKRNRLNVGGKRALKSVRAANKIARRVAYLIHFIEKKDAYWVIENPISSLLFMYRPIRRALQREGIFCVNVPLGQFGATSQSLGVCAISYILGV